MSATQSINGDNLITAWRNQIPDPDLIEVGQQLTINVGQALEHVEPAVAPAVEPPAASNGLTSDLAQIINQTEGRTRLLNEAEAAIASGNQTMALTIADLFIRYCTDQDGLRAGAELYLRVADQLYDAGSYARASLIYRQLATRFSGSDQTLMVFPSEQINIGRSGITIRPAHEGERQVYFRGTAYVNVLEVPISRAAVARAEQAEFLVRSGIDDPFDLSQVRTYFLSLSADEVGPELQIYLSSFYFHIGSNVPDDASLSTMAAYPRNIFGQRPVDCRVYTQLARHVLSQGVLRRIVNFFSGTAAPYQFRDIYTTRTSYGIRRSDSGHQMLLIETANGALLLNNDTVINLENASPDSIRSALRGVMIGLGYELTETNDLPMTHFVVVEDGRVPDAGDFDSAYTISDN